MSNKGRRVCPVERAGGLDSKIRRWVQDPQKILGPYIQEGMTVLALGCGPGRVIASDLQEGMLDRLRDKIRGTELADRIILHKCENDKIGVPTPVDFILAFYMAHEVPDKGQFFAELGSILKPAGQILITEPPFHVSKRAFETTVTVANEAGLTDLERPRMFPNKAVLLSKARH